MRNVISWKHMLQTQESIQTIGNILNYGQNFK